MKKLFLAAFAVFAVLTACQREELAQPISEYDELNVSIEEMTLTKTYMDEDNKVLWSEDDRIVAFMYSTLSAQYKVKSGGKPTASFAKVSSDDLGSGSKIDHIVAYYPYSDMIECEKVSKGYSMNVVLPAQQAYVPNSFGNGSLPMASISADNNITFCNVSGAMKLQLKGTAKVASVKVEGKNSEKLSGAAIVTVYNDGSRPSISMSSGASTSVLLDCGDGVQLNKTTAAELIISIPPVIFSKGFTVTITDTAGSVYTIDTDKRNEVKRSSLLIMPQLTLDASHREPMEGDYIDEYGINHGPGIEIDGTVWAPVNCGYHATDFKYGKLYQWGRKYGQGYSGDFYINKDDPYGTYSDAASAEFADGPVTILEGNHPDNANVYYVVDFSNDADWLYGGLTMIWNRGNDNRPRKTEYDPCPDGWRVPTINELSTLIKHQSSWATNEDGQDGFWLSGSNQYSSDAPQIFLPAAGANNVEGGYYRGRGGFYWSSSIGKVDSFGTPTSQRLFFEAVQYTDWIYKSYRNDSYSIRCVYDGSELIKVSSITLDASSVSLLAGEYRELDAAVAPSDASHKDWIIWYSSDESVATVDQFGVVTAVAGGTTTITALAGMQSATCDVVVEVIPVGNVTLNHTSLTFPVGFEYTLTAKVSPHDASYKTVNWTTDNPSIVNVDQSGNITTISSGEANITAEAGGVKSVCVIKVIEQAVASKDYVDEYGINHGKGIAVGSIVWAPVNCGYKSASDDSNGFPDGKLYQWGRKYGQGHSYDESVPDFLEGPISVNNGQNDQYANTFFVSTDNPYDWAMPKNDSLWNSGTEEDPIKTDYDPCPEGWRVPTSTELYELGQNHEMNGIIESFSGIYTYIEGIPSVMLPNNPYRWSSGEQYNMGRYDCSYWSSSVSVINDASYILSCGISVYTGLNSSRATGCSVRCVQE